MRSLVSNGLSSIYHTRSFTPNGSENIGSARIHVIQIHPFSGWSIPRRKKNDPSVRLQVRFDGSPTPRFHILKIEKVVSGGVDRGQVIFEAGLCLEFFKGQFCKGLLDRL